MFVTKSMRIPFLAAILFLGVSISFGWQAIQTSAPATTSSPIMTEAARLVSEGDERFSTNLNGLRTALTAVDPDTTLRPKSWAALNQVIAARDEWAREQPTGKEKLAPATATRLQTAMQTLLVACNTEESLAAVQTARREGFAATLMVALLAAAAAVGCVVTALFESRLAKALIGAGSAPKGHSLMAQIGYVLQELERAKKERAAQERHSLEQALALRRERRERRVEKPVEPPPTAPPPPAPSTPPSPPTSPRGPRRLDEGAVSSDKHSAFPTPPDEPEGFIFERSQAVLHRPEADDEPAPGPAVTGDTGSHFPALFAGVSSVLQLRQSGCEVVVIVVEDVDLFHHRYNQPEAVLAAALHHIATLLMGNRVTPEELALEHDTVYWALPEDAAISEPQIELFVRELYQDSVFRFQGKRLDLPNIKISLAPAARKVIKPAC